MAQDGREGGFIKLHRRLRSWPLWQSMTALQQRVWVEMLLEANWKAGEFWYGSTRVEVSRGQYATSEGEIAKLAKVDRQVVRDTYAKTEREGSITRERTLFGNRALTLVTIVNYERFQGNDADENPAENQPRTKEEPRENQGRTPIEEGEEGKKGKKEALRRPAPVLLQAQCPSLASLLDAAAGAGLDVDPGRTTPQWDEAEALVRTHGAEAALACWTACAARRSSPGPMPLAYALPAMREIGRPAPPRQRQPYRNPLDDNRVDDRQEAARTWFDSLPSEAK